MDLMLYIDFETRSAANLQHGVWGYSLHPSTEVICLAWAVDSGPVSVWVPGDDGPDQLLEVVQHWSDPIEAHNASFEKSIWLNICVKQYGWPLIESSRWRCSMATAAACGLPQSLDNCARVLGVDYQKDQTGHRAMLQLCKPLPRLRDQQQGLFDDHNGPGFDRDPAKLQQVYEYCRQDVATERAISEAMPKMSESELAVWQMDQDINQRGIMVDRELCQAAIDVADSVVAEIDAEMTAITDGAVTRTTQGARLIEWLASRGCHTESVDKGAVIRLLSHAAELPDDVVRALELRQLSSRSSTAKYQSMLDHSSTDGRMRHQLRYHGAHPGRWSGCGVQIQNFPRG